MRGRKPVLSVTADDCEWQTFRAGGKGGQNQNKRETGVRVIHHPSGARGESRQERSQLQNKKLAFRRMTESAKFKIWLNRVLANGPTPEERVERDLDSKNLLIEARENGVWKRMAVKANGSPPLS